jgi:hypothetical protein
MKANMSKVAASKSIGGSPSGGDLMAWMVAFTPPALVGLLGAVVFQDVVVKSIETASHPSLVYGILLAFVLGILLCGMSLARFQAERRYVRNWAALKSNEERRIWVENHASHGKVIVYPALAAIVLQMPSSERQAKFEHEVRAVETALSDKLVFPNFIAGSLVGLGLVGTFVGLLGTLEDLGAVFGSLAKTGDTGANPTAVFADMVQKLQDPMRGMGTAFVTSLYGLLGSLVVGLCSLSVSKSGNAVIKHLYSAERLFSSQALERFTPDTFQVASGSGNVEQLQDLVARVLEAQSTRDTSLQTWAEGSEKRLSKLLDQMLEANWSASSELVTNSQKAINHFVEVINQQNDNTQIISKQLAQQQRTLTDTVRLLGKQVNDERALLQRDVLAMIERNQAENKEDIARMEKMVTQIAELTNRSVGNFERYIHQQERVMGSLPKTHYWKEAWSKVQLFLRKSEKEADLALLARAVERQTLVLHRLTKQMTPPTWTDRPAQTDESNRFHQG